MSTFDSDSRQKKSGSSIKIFLTAQVLYAVYVNYYIHGTFYFTATMSSAPDRLVIQPFSIWNRLELVIDNGNLCQSMDHVISLCDI